MHADSINEAVYSSNFDYSEGSPHLKHPKLYAGLIAQLRGTMADAASRGLPKRLLEIGAGEGSFVEPSLAFGFSVDVSEMSRYSIQTLMERFGQNPNFSSIYDEDGSLSGLHDKRYAVILYASVLHHIPDYVAAVDNAITGHLEPGGSFLSFQDPLWYPSVTQGTRLMARAAYLSWRLGQGDYGRGLRTLGRRVRGIYDESEPSDMVEYHVVRNGVDHERLVEFLSDRFDDVSLLPYWSTQAALWQKAGERLNLENTFAIRARGFRG